jgi:hypothetical protein
VAEQGYLAPLFDTCRSLYALALMFYQSFVTHTHTHTQKSHLHRGAVQPQLRLHLRAGARHLLGLALLHVSAAGGWYRR